MSLGEDLLMEWWSAAVAVAVRLAKFGRFGIMTSEVFLASLELLFVM